jgi:hypothetical protein
MCSRTTEILAAPHTYGTTTKAVAHHAKKLTFVNFEKPNEPKKFSDVKNQKSKMPPWTKIIDEIIFKVWLLTDCIKVLLAHNALLTGK